MTDQATTLRIMASAAEKMPLTANQAINTKPVAAKPQTRTIAIASGKGGVGKSNLSVNLMLELAALKKKVTLLDADMGLANADLLLGINPQYHLGHLFSGDCTLDELVIELDDNIRLIAGGSGIESLSNIGERGHTLLLSELQEVESTSDFFLIDTAGGISENVTGVFSASSEIIVITNPEPTAIVDAYATMKVIFQKHPDMRVWVVVNSVVNLYEAEQVFNQLNAAAERFLKNRVEFLGAIPYDEQLVEAVCEQIPVTKFAPTCPASRAIRLIAKNLNDLTKHAPQTVGANANSFWHLLARTEA